MIAAVDGCRGGWVVAQADAWPPRWCGLLRCDDFAQVLEVTRACAAVVVDIPIGLLEVPDARECDREARCRLGRAAPRVFAPLPRPVLDCATDGECERLYRQRFGRGVSKQSLGLRRKLLEVDRSMTPRRQRRIREFHPELVWQRWNSGRPLPSKHTARGIAERRRLLRGWLCHVERVLATRPPGCTLHDALDALVGLELAQRIVQKPSAAERLPRRPPRDARGLRMEIWF